MSAPLDFKTLFSRVRRIGAIAFDELPAPARPIVATLLEKKATYPAPAVTRVVCRTEIDPSSQSTQIVREQTGEYEVFNDGGQKKIVTDSIFDRMIRAVVASYPPGGAIPKIRESKTKFRRIVRARTAAELEGLRKGNAQRHAEAVAHREPAAHCRCCTKALTDPVSIERGIGPECWVKIAGLSVAALIRNGAETTPLALLPRLDVPDLYLDLTVYEFSLAAFHGKAGSLAELDELRRLSDIAFRLQKRARARRLDTREARVRALIGGALEQHSAAT
jgi:hypothetical protein